MPDDTTHKDRLHRAGAAPGLRWLAWGILVRIGTTASRDRPGPLGYTFIDAEDFNWFVGVFRFASGQGVIEQHADEERQRRAEARGASGLKWTAQEKQDAVHLPTGT